MRGSPWAPPSDRDELGHRAHDRYGDPTHQQEVDVRQLVPRLVQRGMTQHFAVAPGRIADILAYWCELSHIEFFQELPA